MAPHTKPSVHLLPNALLSSQKAKLLRLKHPHTGLACYFVCDEENRNIYEVQGIDENYRSWFINGNVYSDGSIKLATPYNPIFLILPYLIRTKRNVPLDQLLEDDNCPEMTYLTDFITDLSCVADQRGEESLNVWCYNEKSTLDWLSKKIDKLATKLKDNKEQTSMTNALASDEDSYKVLAFGILSECLCEELLSKLRDHLQLPALSSEKTLNDSTNQNMAKKARGDDSPNSATPSHAKKSAVSKPSCKEKALAKSAKGSMSITSFFSKKGK